MTDQPAGPILDGLGLTLDLNAGDLIASALVVAKVITADGDVTLLVAGSEGLCWLDQLGLLTAANDLIRTPGGYTPRDEDDSDASIG